MRNSLGALVLLLLALACEGPDPERDGFVLVDQSAIAAGIEVTIDGERHASHLPLVVPEGAEAAIVHASGLDEPFAVGAGELVEVVGPDGELRRATAPRDRVWVEGEPASVTAFAQMIGAEATRLPGGDWAVSGPDAFVLASLMGGLTDVRAIAPAPATTSNIVDVGVFLGRRGTPPSADLRAVEPRGPVPDAAALVGLYQHGRIGLLLDAAGGYTLFESSLEHAVVSGRYRPRPGGVDFIPNDGGAAAVMELEGERLVDDLGIGFRAVEGQQ